MTQTSDLAGIVGEAKEPVRQESEERDPIPQDHNTLELTPNAESPTPPQLK